MSFLRNAVSQMIATMEPADRREAILTVASQALAQMSEGERIELIQQLFGLLIESLDGPTRRRLAGQLGQLLAQLPASG
jgi:hypothetical protein